MAVPCSIISRVEPPARIGLPEAALSEINCGKRLFFLLHGAAATFDGAGASLGDNHLRAAFATDINLTKLISHFLLFS